MRSITVLSGFLVLSLAACGPGGSVDSTSDAAVEEPDADIFIDVDAAPRPDSRPRADAAPEPDAPKADAAPGTPDAAPSPDAMPQPPVGVTDGNFAIMNFDTNNVANDCTISAPWGDDSWGIQGITYSEAATSDLTGSRFRVNNGTAYLYGKETDGRWGLVRFIQGDVWGAARCGTIPWNVFTPIAVAGKDIDASLKVFRDTDILHNDTSAWVSMAVNLWFSSPNMPAAGNDKNSKKPLVLDMIFYRECNPGSVCSSLTPVEEAGVYHYRKVVTQVPSQSNTQVNMDVRAALDEAIDTFSLGAAEATLKLYQAEVIITVRNAEGAATIDDFTLNIN